MGNEVDTNLEPWLGPEGELSKSVMNGFVAEIRDTYSISNDRISNDFKIVEFTWEGDYRERQIVELVQNAADAILEQKDILNRGGKIKIVLDRSGIYVANEGAPFSLEGIRAIGFPIMSHKGAGIGRYGQGFRSVIAVTDRPRIYSRTGSFHYSFENSLSLLTAPIAHLKPIPSHLLGSRENPTVNVLACPMAVDPFEYSKDDPTLADLMTWATTVIHLPFREVPNGSAATSFEVLKNSLIGFPHEFLSFAPHVRSIQYDIRDDHLWETREISCESTLVVDAIERPAVEVRRSVVDSGGGRKEHYLVVTNTGVVVPEDIATQGVSANRRRDELGVVVPIQLSWAFPSVISNKRGLFWFYFPTRVETTVSGILNGPWDTDGSRMVVLSPETSGYNKFLVSQMARLIVETIPFLVAMYPEDVGRYLDLFPARGDEEGSEIAKLLVSEVRRVIVQRESIPDLDGNLVKPDSLRRPPSSVSEEIQELWALSRHAPRNFPHWTTQKGNRLSRVNSYLDEAMHADGIQPLEIKDWLELLVKDRSPESSIDALMIAKEISKTNFVIRDQAMAANIVLLADGNLAPPTVGKAFLGDAKLAKPGIAVIDIEVQSSDRAREFLIDDCGITSADEAADLDILLSQWPSTPEIRDWESFWATVKNSSDEEVLDAINRHKVTEIKVCCIDGSWREISSCLFSGVILVPGTPDDQFIVDIAFHSKNKTLLVRMGVSDSPVIDGANTDIDEDYKSYVKDSVRPARMSPAKINHIISSVQKMPIFFRIASQLTEAARSRLTSWVLGLESGFLRIETKPGDIGIDQPLLWWCRRNGLADTSIGPRQFHEALTPSASRFKLVAPVWKLDQEISFEFGLASTISELPISSQMEIFERTCMATDDQLIGETLSQLSRGLQCPDKIPTKVGNGIVMSAPSVVQTETDYEVFIKLAEKNIPVILAPSVEAAQLLLSNWGVGKSDQQQSYQPDGESQPVLLADRFFLLDQMHHNAIYNINYVECSALQRVISTIDGQTTVTMQEGLQDRNLFVVVDNDDNADLLILQAANKLLKLELTPDDFRSITDYLKDEELQDRKRLVRQAASEVERVKALFSVEDMQQLLPSAVLDEIPNDKENDQVLAEMLLAVHGPQLLRHAKNVLRRAGFDAPETWAGGQPAMKFVMELGFDRSFAGFKSDDVGPHLDVAGRVDLHELHDYQVPLKDQIKEFIRRGPVDGAWRSLLYLPTGAGKTRVTVDAVLELLDTGHFKDSPVIWITQSHELCEQAVQAFQEVWSSRGNSGTLSIDRLWDRYTVEPAGIPHEYVGQIVIATIDKLLSPKVFKTASYEWLANAGLVIIDEAHKAVSKSYSEVLRWFETGVGRPGSKNSDSRPLLGLSATPGKKGVESRFRERIEIPKMFQSGKELTNVEYLRQEKVLAIPMHDVLTFDGENIKADDEAIKKFNTMPAWLPQDMEEKLALSQIRNQSILEKIRKLDPSWQIIVFALSVSHAQFLAALLTKEGISAAAVYSGTTPGVRRLHIKNFREGKTRVLTNFNVLSTGFDAPKVRAILIARPCYSDSAYLQMIGRGLRGPKNGGTDECLIIDIKDNIENMPIDLVYKRMSGWFSEDGPDEFENLELDEFNDDFDDSLQ